jgi:tRNA modification GTPase
MADGSTIFALSSGSGKAGLAVIRVSGPEARAVMSAMLSREVEDRRAAFRRILHPVTRELLDTAVVVFFAGPKSETGEDVVEFQIHGGRATIRATLEALATIPGCRMAEPGEFARRAFLSGQLNLAQVEQLGDLIDAETEAQRRLALTVTPQLYEDWRGQLIEIAGLVEAAIDFSDEGDVADRAVEMAREKAKGLRDRIARHLDDGHRGEILRDGFRVALLGAPNAGKSSLLNALARREAAIVSQEAGTTRDVIEVRLDLGGYPVIVSDTAGIREAEGQVEREGIRRSLAAAREANLTLWLTETGIDAPPDEISRETTLSVRTKIDLQPFPTPLGETLADGRMQGRVLSAKNDSPLTPTLSPRGEGDVAISTKTGEGLEQLIGEIAKRAASAMTASADPVVARARHRGLLEDAFNALTDFLSGDPDAAELRAEDVRRAAHALGRITGRVDVEDVLGEIFSRFCIGK